MIKLLTVETAAPSAPPARLRIMRGESWTLRAIFLANGSPLSIPEGSVASLYWQTPGMGASWWTASGRITGSSVPGAIEADWTPACDGGSNVYAVYLSLALPGGAKNYSAWWRLEIAHAPGETPNELPLPVPVLDFAVVEVLNAPYYTMSQANARYLTPTIGDERYAPLGEPTVYTRLTIRDNNEDNSLTFASDAHTITIVRNESAVAPQTYTLTLPLSDGTLALTADIPVVPAIDATLTVSGATADAKATGEAIKTRAPRDAIRYTLDTIERSGWDVPETPVTFAYDGTDYDSSAQGSELQIDSSGYIHLDGVYVAFFNVSTGLISDINQEITDLKFGTITPAVGDSMQPVLGLKDRSVQFLDLAVASTEVSLPAPVSGHARDLYVCVSNTSGAAATIELAGLGTAYAVRVPDGEDLADMTSFDAGARADLYITETPEVHSGLPVLKIVRQDLDAVVASVSS